MSLNDQLNSFKAKVRNAPVLAKRIVPEQPPEEEDSGSRKRRGIVYSQPPNTGTGTHRSTQLVHAIDYLRKQESPILLSDLESYLSSPIAPLVPMLRQHKNIRVDLKLLTATYVSKFDVYSAEDLLRFLKDMDSFTGVNVKELKDGWSQAIPTINRLESEQKLLVLRNKKDNTPRIIWPNNGGPIGTFDKELVDLWRTVKVPTENDLPGALERVGLRPSSVDPSSVKHVKSGNDKKPKRAHRSKMTNTHLGSVLKEYPT